MIAERVAGSFRDRKGYVFTRGERILRSVSASAAPVQRDFIDSKIFAKLVASGQFIGTGMAGENPGDLGIPNAAMLLEHERIPFVSFPYEWSFAALRSAALLQLDVHLQLLDHGFTLSDASAYNIQFRGPDPVFIDCLSVERYVDGDYWLGHRQFCDQFLSPLLYSAKFGIPFNAMYRGRLEGVSSTELASLLRWRDKFSLQTLLNIVIPSRLEASARQGRVDPKKSVSRRALPKSSLRAMLMGLRRWIERLELPSRLTDWTSYATDNTYRNAEREAKRAFVASAVQAAAPGVVLDLGCNTGDYSKLALEAGAGLIVGGEADPATADIAFMRAKSERLNFLPLVLDAANPSPAQGWLDQERPSFAQRGRFDFLVALAVEHHLAIGRNVPLDQLIKWMVGLAPQGMIEFVQKSDTTIQRMLALREDIFADYTEDNFRNLLAANARIVDSAKVSEEGRIIFHFDRR